MTEFPKRFYKIVAVTGETPPYGIALDGRPVRTPMKALLTLPSRGLAEAIAAEWTAQGEVIDPFSMPLTRLANTAIDRVAPDRARIIAEIAQMAGHDLVCYRAETPEGLRERQAAAWDPIVDWAMEQLDAPFAVTSGVVHVDQPVMVRSALSRWLDSQSDWALTAIHNMATLTNSALVAAHCAVRPGDAAIDWARAHVDEDWQIAHWGQDAEARDRRERRKGEFDACVRLLALAQ